MTLLLLSYPSLKERFPLFASVPHNLGTSQPYTEEQEDGIFLSF